MKMPCSDCASLQSITLITGPADCFEYKIWGDLREPTAVAQQRFYLSNAASDVPYRGALTEVTLSRERKYPILLYSQTYLWTETEAAISFMRTGADSGATISQFPTPA
ncbi:protein of unknown function [Hyphomicrobium sp. MC1]|nr:protein of unknown function [Hyphomicrobium sp. MC1]